MMSKGRKSKEAVNTLCSTPGERENPKNAAEFMGDATTSIVMNMIIRYNLNSIQSNEYFPFPFPFLPYRPAIHSDCC